YRRIRQNPPMLFGVAIRRPGRGRKRTKNRAECKKGRYSIWKVKSTRYDASDFFSPGRPEERGATDGRNARPLRSFVSVGLRLCRISSTVIVLPIRVEHSIRVKAAPTPFVQNKAEYNEI